jgi:putative flippase GtrA
MAIRGKEIDIELIIVDDASKDKSLELAHQLASTYDCIRVFAHEKNMGKGAALRTGFTKATGDFVAVQDADLEYDPQDLLRLVKPLVDGDADVVLGSRFLTTHAHRVLHYWHSMGNRLLTVLSNMFTDMNLSDMETCYKVFRREIIQSITVEENRFGFEPEVVAKIADMRCRVYEMGISYKGRTYEEGKKIGMRDGFRALYCIVRYNAHRAPLPVQFGFYLLIGGTAAICNLLLFLVLVRSGIAAGLAAPIAFCAAAALNYWLCIKTIFRHHARWLGASEILVYCGLVLFAALIDSSITLLCLSLGSRDWVAKLAGTVIALFANFLGRRFVVFPEASRGPWATQSTDHS